VKNSTFFRRQAYGNAQEQNEIGIRPFIFRTRPVEDKMYFAEMAKPSKTSPDVFPQNKRAMPRRS
jgi:hypothetical protein